MNNTLQVPENSKIVKFGAWFFILIMLGSFVSYLSWSYSNNVLNEEGNLWAFIISSFVLFVLFGGIYNRTIFLSNSETPTANAIRKVLKVLKWIILIFSVVYYVAQLSFVNSGLQSSFLISIKSLWCTGLTGVGYYVLNAIMLLAVVLEIIYSKRESKKSVFTFLLYGILLSATLFLSSIMVLVC